MAVSFDDGFEALRNALDDERSLRLISEDALEGALEEVRVRSAALQLKLERRGQADDRLPGSPRRLQHLATTTDAGEYLPSAEAELSRATGLQEELLSARSELSRLRLEAAERDREIAELKSAAEEERTQATTASKQLAAATREADAAVRVLHRLLDLSRAKGNKGAAGSSSSDNQMEVEDEEPPPPPGVLADGPREAWIEKAALRVSRRIEEVQRRQAGWALREEELHGQLRSRQLEGVEVVESERRRAERAEARCQQLVKALRALERKVVDDRQHPSHYHQQVGQGQGGAGFAASSLMRTEELRAEHARGGESAGTFGAAHALGQFYSHTMREQRHAKEEEAARAAAAQRRRSKQALQHQLALPGMAACLVAP